MTLAEAVAAILADLTLLTGRVHALAADVAEMKQTIERMSKSNHKVNSKSK